MDIYAFQDPQQEKLFQKITKELRCSVCQNQALFDSNVPIAVDLRQQIYRKILAKESEQDIVNYVVQRYGNTVLFEPPFNWGTSFLWILPVLMIIIGMGYLIKQLKKT